MNFQTIKLSLYYAKACNEFMGPVFMTKAKATANYVDAEAIVNCLYVNPCL